MLVRKLDLIVTCYPSFLLRINSRNGDRGSDDPSANGRHYPHRSGDGHGSSNGTSDGSDGDPLADTYGDGSDSSSSSEFGKIIQT